jgi:hypothetical protein
MRWVATTGLMLLWGFVQPLTVPVQWYPSIAVSLALVVVGSTILLVVRRGDGTRATRLTSWVATAIVALLVSSIGWIPQRQVPWAIALSGCFGIIAVVGASDAKTERALGLILVAPVAMWCPVFVGLIRRLIHEAETVGVNSRLTTANTGIWRGRE